MSYTKYGFQSEEQNEMIPAKWKTAPLLCVWIAYYSVINLSNVTELLSASQMDVRGVTELRVLKHCETAVILWREYHECKLLFTAVTFRIFLKITEIIPVTTVLFFFARHSANNILYETHFSKTSKWLYLVRNKCWNSWFKFNLRGLLKANLKLQNVLK